MNSVSCHSIPPASTSPAGFCQCLLKTQNAYNPTTGLLLKYKILFYNEEKARTTKRFTSPTIIIVHIVCSRKVTDKNEIILSCVDLLLCRGHFNDMVRIPYRLGRKGYNQVFFRVISFILWWNIPILMIIISYRKTTLPWCVWQLCEWNAMALQSPHLIPTE